MKNNLGNKKILAKNLQYYMDIHHKTRRDIEHDLKFPYTTITNWLNADRYPRIDNIEMLADYFNIDKSDLVEDHTDKTRISGQEYQLIQNFRKLALADQEIVLTYIATKLTMNGSAEQGSCAL